MPLSADENVNETASKLLDTLKGAFGTPDGYRPAHARGRMVSGTFTPSPEASSLSKAPHFQDASTPVIVRFSSSTGIHNIPDTDAKANPRGIAIRFVLDNNGHSHTDIIAHSTPFFPVRTGEKFLAMLQAIGNGTFGEFLQDDPSAAAFVQAPKPSPGSFATERYYGVNAFKMIASDGQETFIRYRIVPDAGYSALSEAETATKSDSYLFEELPERLAGRPATFTLLAQVAQEGDATDDATKHWPEDRRQVRLGTIKLDKVEAEADSKKDEQKIIYDPIPRVEGIQPSADPLLEMRASVYLQSGKQRRAAPSLD